jgi:hypothetical protein
VLAASDAVPQESSLGCILRTRCWPCWSAARRIFFVLGAGDGAHIDGVTTLGGYPDLVTAAVV